MMDTIPIASWDLQASPVPSRAVRSLRWSSNSDPMYIGPSGEWFHHRTLDTNRAVFTFETHRLARFVFHYTLDASDEALGPVELRDLLKCMVYIN
jgi:hypothetical protein